MNLPPCYPDSYQNAYILAVLKEKNLNEEFLNYLFENEIKIGWIPDDNHGYS